MMTKERAEEIRAFVWRNMQSSRVNYTQAELDEIRAYWDTCPGTWSFYDTVASMARGEHLPKVQDK